LFFGNWKAIMLILLLCVQAALCWHCSVSTTSRRSDRNVAVTSFCHLKTTVKRAEAHYCTKIYVTPTLPVRNSLPSLLLAGPVLDDPRFLDRLPVAERMPVSLSRLCLPHQTTFDGGAPTFARSIKKFQRRPALLARNLGKTATSLCLCKYCTRKVVPTSWRSTFIVSTTTTTKKATQTKKRDIGTGGYEKTFVSPLPSLRHAMTEKQCYHTIYQTLPDSPRRREDGMRQW